MNELLIMEVEKDIKNKCMEMYNQGFLDCLQLIEDGFLAYAEVGQKHISMTDIFKIINSITMVIQENQ